MDADEITRLTLEALDEDMDAEATTVEEEPPEEPVEGDEEPSEDEQEERLASPEELAEEPTEEPGEDEEEAEAEEPEEEEEVEAEQDDLIARLEADPDVAAYLRRYQGDLERAFKGAVQLQRALSHQNEEKNVLGRRLEQVERELAQARALSQSGHYLEPAQREWIDSALASGDVRGHVGAALEAGEFDLGRALIDEYAQEQPYEAMKLAQLVDGMQQQPQQVEEEVPVDQTTLLNALTNYVPDLDDYAAAMNAEIERLGDEHPFVRQARNKEDWNIATQGIMALYTLARSRSSEIQSSRDQVARKKRESAANGRANAVVTSAQSTPSAGESPRPVKIAPGLTLEQLDAELAQ